MNGNNINKLKETQKTLKHNSLILFAIPDFFNVLYNSQRSCLFKVPLQLFFDLF